VVAWHNKGEGAIILAGGYGVGKTHLAQIVKNHWGYGCIFRGEAKLLAEVRQSYRDSNGQGERQIIRKYRDAPLLIIDDLGTAYVKEGTMAWYEDLMWRLLDDRSVRNTPTMITTNLTLAKLTLRLGVSSELFAGHPYARKRIGMRLLRWFQPTRRLGRPATLRLNIV
jgi:DNA replication protein DnaC